MVTIITICFDGSGKYYDYLCDPSSEGRFRSSCHYGFVSGIYHGNYTSHGFTVHSIRKERKIPVNVYTKIRLLESGLAESSRICAAAQPVAGADEPEIPVSIPKIILTDRDRDILDEKIPAPIWERYEAYRKYYLIHEHKEEN